MKSMEQNRKTYHMPINPILIKPYGKYAACKTINKGVLMQFLTQVKMIRVFVAVFSAITLAAVAVSAIESQLFSSEFIWDFFKVRLVNCSK